MKILIIGSKGMLGQYMAEVLKDYDLICWDREDLDITNQNQVNTKIVQAGPDVVINCAAYNNVDGAESEPELANLINGYAVGYLARAADEVGAVIVHFSTNYVFNGDKPYALYANKSQLNNFPTPQPPLSGGLRMDGYSESDIPDPRSVYARSKLLGENELKRCTDRYYILRTSRLFGKEGSGENCKKNFVDLIIETAQKNNYKIKAVDEEYDLPTYAFDLAGKAREIIERSCFVNQQMSTFHKSPQPPFAKGGLPVAPSLIRGARGVMDYGIYHVVNSGVPCTWYGFACEIFRIKNMDVEIVPVSGDAFGVRAAKRLAYGALRNTKLDVLRGWKEALGEYLR